MTDADIEHPDRLGELDYSDEWLCAVGRQLAVGDEVFINLRRRPLTVTNRSLDASGFGSAYPYRVIELEGNGTTYTLRIPDKDQTPTFDWPSSNGGVFAYRIETAGGTTALVAETSASEFVAATVDSTHAPNLSPTRTALAESVPDDAPVLGFCPACSSEVVAVADERAVCRECDLWCWIDQWSVFDDGGTVE